MKAEASSLNSEVSLTDQEKQVLDHLTEAWNGYVALNGGIDDAYEFGLVIHQAQRFLSLRVARRADPDFWSKRR